MGRRQGKGGIIKDGPEVVGVITAWEYQVSGDGAIIHVTLDDERSNAYLLHKSRSLRAELQESVDGRTRVRVLEGGTMFGEDMIFEQRGEQ